MKTIIIIIIIIISVVYVVERKEGFGKKINNEKLNTWK